MPELRDEPVEPEVVSSELVYSGHVWDVRNETVRFGDGEITRQFVDHPGAAAVVAIDDEERVVLIQQYRHPIRHRDWEIPAGLLDVAGEPPIETARRELAEEVDLVAESLEPLVSIFTTPGGNDEIIHVYSAPTNGLVGPWQVSNFKVEDPNNVWDNHGQRLAVSGGYAVYTRERRVLPFSTRAWQLWARSMNPGRSLEFELTGNADPGADIDLVVPIPEVNGVPGLLELLTTGSVARPRSRFSFW